MLYKRGRSAQDQTETKAKQNKEIEYHLNKTTTSYHYTALLEDETEDQQHKAYPRNNPNHTPIYIIGSMSSQHVCC
jgi:hypothetical protein